MGLRLACTYQPVVRVPRRIILLDFVVVLILLIFGMIIVVLKGDAGNVSALPGLSIESLLKS